MPQKQLNFTKKALLSVPIADAGKRDYYRDTKTRGLVLAVTHAGTKSFQVYRWVEGRPERITVGRFPDLTVEQARGFADKINAEIATGHNPNDSRRQIRAEMTVAELFSVYLQTHAKVLKKSWQEDQGQYNRHLTRWARRRLSQIRGTDVQALHQKIGREKGLYAANRLLSLLHAMFNKAIQWGWDGANPASGIQKFKEHSRERFLEAHELPRFFKALAEEPNHTIRDYVLISLLTGARKSNVLAMKWDDISLESAVWSIPDTKNGSPHRIPLSKPALDILTARKQGSDSEFVFPGIGRSRHLT